MSHLPFILQPDDETEDCFPDLAALRAARPMGELLVMQQRITQDQLRIALTEQKQRGTQLGATLVALGFLSEDDLAIILAEKAGIAAINLEGRVIDATLAARIPQDIAEDKLILPVAQSGQQMIVAMADPFDIVAMDTMRRLFPRGVALSPRVASRQALRAAIRDVYGRGPSVEAILREIADNTPCAGDPPAVRLVDALLSDAIERGASDIHLEPESAMVRVRLRLDGALRQTHAFHLSLWSAVSHRLKIKAGMDIADTRSIQDGRFRMASAGHEVDCRVAIMPSIWGETIVVRLLDPKRGLLPIEQLGYGENALERLQTIADKPSGIVLLTGPTGSGKTTTLYSLLQKIATPDLHVATLEDPVEYQMEQVRQTAIQDEHGLGFAEGVRGLLRMDPDVILIGEIRDAETAQMALRAAMTGHKVYATLHCNDALGAIARLVDLGIRPTLLAGNLAGIAAQRLVRCLCPACKKRTRLPAGLFAQEAKINAAAPTGCPACEGTGRKGRTVVSEIIPITPRLDDLIASGGSRAALWEAARAQGLTTLREDGLAKVAEGLIALEDLRRQVDLTEDGA